MDRKGFYRKLIPLMLPIAFQSLMLSLVSASDTLMLGLVDQASISSVSLASQVYFVFSLVIYGLTGGASILAAQYWGKGSREAVEQVFALLLRPLSLAGGLFTLATLLIPEAILRIFTPDPQLIALGAGYLRVVSMSYLLDAVSQSYLCMMRNCGRAGTTSLITSVSVVMNILLNALLIFGLLGLPAMGIQGAALATVLTKVISLVWAVAESFRSGGIRLRRKYLFARQLSLRRDYWHYTVPVFFNNLVWGVGITMGSVILGHLGTDAVAANSIAVVVKNLVACLCMGLGSAGSILVGNALGAGHLDTGKRYGQKVVNLSILTGLASGAVLIALTGVILNLAELSDQATSYLRWMIVMCAVNLAGMSHNTATISGIFSAGGDTRFGLICDMITLWCVVVPLGLLAAFVFRWPVLVVYILINMDEIIKLPAVRVHYRKYKWVRDLTREGESL